MGLRSLSSDKLRSEAFGSADARHETFTKPLVRGNAALAPFALAKPIGGGPLPPGGFAGGAPLPGGPALAFPEPGGGGACPLPFAFGADVVGTASEASAIGPLPEALGGTRAALPFPLPFDGKVGGKPFSTLPPVAGAFPFSRGVKHGLGLALASLWQRGVVPALVEVLLAAGALLHALISAP